MLCTYERTLYENPSNGFCISSFVTDDTSVPNTARNKKVTDNRIHFTAKGYDIPKTSAINLNLGGEWEESKYGLQFSISSFEEIIPQTKEGITAYLSSGLIKGVGEKTAKNIVDTFGVDTLKVFDEEPNKLTQIRGITPKKLNKIINSYNKSRYMREILSYLTPYGISVNKIYKIRDEFGENSAKIVREQPFMLCSISGFGFKTVDAIARKTNTALNDPMRIRGAAFFILDEAQMNGNLFIPADEYKNRTLQLLCENFDYQVVTMDEVVQELRTMLREKLIFVDNKNIYSYKCLNAEKQTAENISKFIGKKIKYDKDVDAEIELSQKRLGITLSTAQKLGVKTCLENKLAVITGDPGTGKTTVLKVILDVYKQLNKGEILLTAPTGRAARRMAESTGVLEAKTLHSALGLMGGDEDNSTTEDMLYEDFIIADEMSMVDMFLANELFSRTQTGSQLLFLGDTEQLPSVGAGNVLRELIKCGLIPIVVLDTVFRQSKTSRISLNAEKIKKNDTKILYGSDFDFIDALDESDAAQIVTDLYVKEVNDIGLDNVQILAPFKNRGATSVNMMNSTLREIINEKDVSKAELQIKKRIFRVGDRVMQTKNKGDISNGDVGYITGIYTDEDNDSTITVEFSDNRIVEFSPEDTDRLELSYSMTIHKSQGSEYKTVIIPLLSSHYIMLRRNLIYTAITRAKVKVILVGQKKALFTAIHKNDIDKRNTMLAERIRACHQSGKSV